MITKVTKGIKISVKTSYEGTFFKNYRNHFAFGYHITIENQSKDPVQLLARHWEIYDALNPLEMVDGEGVIGKKPVLHPGETHTYSSGCLLTSPIGAMKGHYMMINYASTQHFKVYVPTFRLSAPFTLN
ncbi:Co2+/Mg2+ efflux protein ApaG [Robertkochia sediminum]|uniref:Co2+/Mg2+ efflux protein ApaG n=1 Tax=Robertkochia sediminum TaxID=2785326 RepID=UPI001931A4D3|nr:Co2+/Mg2+ efflux protein ApaG [Robertkochia sediminum]MBL7471709.1 Co2+/Mg2+ efflux protein ApaG [Robertkochia sediminum]